MTTAISSANAALAVSLRGDTQPPLFSNSPLTTNATQIVAGVVANGPQSLIGAISNVAVPSLATLTVQTNPSDITAAVVAASTGSSTSIADLIDNSNAKAAQFSATQAAQPDTSPLQAPDTASKVQAPGDNKPVADVPTHTDDTPVTPQATGSNNNNTNTDTVTTTSSYTAATGAYSSAASFTASAGAAGGGGSVRLSA